MNQTDPVWDKIAELYMERSAAIQQLKYLEEQRDAFVKLKQRMRFCKEERQVLTRRVEEAQKVIKRYDAQLTILKAKPKKHYINSETGQPWVPGESLQAPTHWAMPNAVIHDDFMDSLKYLHPQPGDVLPDPPKQHNYKQPGYVKSKLY